MAVNHKDCPFPCQGIYYWEQPDQSEAVLVKSLEQSIVLNTTGLLIWNLCDGTRDRNELLVAIKNQFPTIEEDILAGDLDKFLKDLVTQGYLRIPGSAT